MKISIDDAVDQKLRNLVTILLDDGYFFMFDNALAYVEWIYTFIYTIPKQTLRKATISEAGVFYCHYKPNRHTTWYILFDIENDDYLIRNIFNNHSPEYPRFISGLK